MGVPITGIKVFGVYIRAPCFGKLPFMSTKTTCAGVFFPVYRLEHNGLRKSLSWARGSRLREGLGSEFVEPDSRFHGPELGRCFNETRVMSTPMTLVIEDYRLSHPKLQTLSPEP